MAPYFPWDTDKIVIAIFSCVVFVLLHKPWLIRDEVIGIVGENIAQQKNLSAELTTILILFKTCPKSYKRVVNYQINEQLTELNYISFCWNEPIMPIPTYSLSHILTSAISLSVLLETS